MRRYGLTALVALMCATVLAGAVAAQQPTTTATQFYMDYRQKFDKATKAEDVMPFMAASVKNQMQATPAAERQKMFDMIKMMGTLTGVKVVKETRTAGGATLTVEGIDSDKKKTTGTVEIVNEKGQWKVGKESWS